MCSGEQGEESTEKAKTTVLVALFVVTLSLLLIAHPVSVSAHLGTPINSGWAYTPPTINGTIAPGEWVNATVRDFTLQMRDRIVGSLNRTLNARLYVMNDWANLYMAVQIFNDDYEAKDTGNYYKGLFVLFDDNHTGVLSTGDNSEGVTTYLHSSFYSDNDLYYTGSSWDADTSAGKTNDGNLSWSHTNPVQYALGNWTFEMRIPLVGSDGGDYDFNITSLPQTVGFKIWFVDEHWSRDGVYPDDPTINTNYDETLNASTYGDLTIHPLYTLTTVATTGGTTNPAPGQHQYPYDTVVSVTATPDQNYVLHHWELDSVNVGNSTYPYLVTMDQNHTLKAVFWPLYTLTIVATTGGTTNPAPGPYIYLNGTVVSVTATPDQNYVLHHWELDSVNVGNSTYPYLVTMDQNHTLKAVFWPLYTLTIVTTTGGTTNPAPGPHIYLNGTVVSVTATPDPWYTLDHWELDAVNVGTTNPYSVTMNSNHTLSAVFIHLYALTITTTAGGTTTPVPGVYIYPNGTVVSVTASANSGYVFDHWQLDTVDVGTANPYSVLMNQNHTLNSVFVPVLAVTISPSSITITLGNSVAFSSTVTGGTMPYSYQWYLNNGQVPGANSGTWTFTPAGVGIYYVYLNVTDFRGRIAVSNTARVVVVPPTPVGGYTVTLDKPASTPLIAPFTAVLMASGAVGAVIGIFTRKRKRQRF